MNIEKLLLKKINLCNSEYNLFQKDERIAVALSGGKDSLSLLKILSKIHNPSCIYPIHIYPYKDSDITDYLEQFSHKLSINPVVFLENSMASEQKCYECARNRRKLIFQEADRLNIYKIALGHTKNDMAETFLMNIFYSGNCDTIRPLQDFFGKFKIIRPLYLLEEKDIIRYTEIYKIIPQNYNCKGKDINKREVIRNLLKNMDGKAADRVFKAALKTF